MVENLCSLKTSLFRNVLKINANQLDSRRIYICIHENIYIKLSTIKPLQYIVLDKDNSPVTPTKVIRLIFLLILTLNQHQRKPKKSKVVCRSLNQEILVP